MIERKDFDVTCKFFEGIDNGQIDLYAAAFGNVDRAGEVIQPGAFKNLDKFIDEGWLTVSHNWDRLPVATIDAASQDRKGLRVQASFHSTAEAQAVRTTIRERLARGKSVRASIGYKVTDDETIAIDGKKVRSLKGIDLYECSIVNVPANDATMVLGAKHTPVDLVAAIKAGRPISAQNLARLRSMAAQLVEFCDEYDVPAISKSARMGMGLYGDFLATSLKYAPATRRPCGTKDEIYREFMAISARYSPDADRRRAKLRAAR